MKKYIKWILKVTVAGGLFVVLLSLIIMIYSYSGVHIKNPAGTTDYTWEPNQIKSTMTEGFAWIRMDENGFNNTNSKILKEKDVLLMGSSQMEAVSVASCYNTGYRLNSLFPNLNIYNIGISGHFIYTNTKNMENAVQTYHPKKYVILETNSVELSCDDMKKVCGGGYETIPSYDSGILYWIQKRIPVIKTLYKQLDDWRMQAVSEKVSTDVSGEDYTSEEYTATLREFLNKAVSPVAQGGAKLIIFYHPPTELDRSGKLLDSTDPAALASFQEACEDNGIIFVDLTEDFEKLYYAGHRLPYGFINTSPGKGHLNKYGHQVIAERLAEVITALEKGQGR